MARPYTNNYCTKDEAINAVGAINPGGGGAPGEILCVPLISDLLCPKMPNNDLNCDPTVSVILG